LRVTENFGKDIVSKGIATVTEILNLQIILNCFSCGAKAIYKITYSF